MYQDSLNESKIKSSLLRLSCLYSEVYRITNFNIRRQTDFCRRYSCCCLCLVCDPVVYFTAVWIVPNIVFPRIFTKFSKGKFKFSDDSSFSYTEIKIFGIMKWTSSRVPITRYEWFLKMYIYIYVCVSFDTKILSCNSLDNSLKNNPIVFTLPSPSHPKALR